MPHGGISCKGCNPTRYTAMSYHIDAKYLNMISSRLPLFTKKKDGLWNMRCTICGDSKTNPRKARGYFYRQRNDLFYKCHNCLASQHFGTFLKEFDPALFKQYVFERYSKGEGQRKAHTKAEPMLEMAAPVFRKKQSPLDQIATRLSTLPEDHPAVVYCSKRGIPVDKFKQLYYVESVKDIRKIAPEYTDTTSEESRIAFPFFSFSGELVGVTMRAINKSLLRYITFTLKEDEPLVFGLRELDLNETIYVVEGPIDSLFLPNAISCSGTSFGKIDTIFQDKIPPERMVIVFDNQPKNVEVCNIMEKYISKQHHVCIWPSWLKEKDINEMILNGHDALKIIQARTFSGLTAKLKFLEWRKC